TIHPLPWVGFQKGSGRPSGRQHLNNPPTAVGGIPAAFPQSRQWIVQAQPTSRNPPYFLIRSLFPRTARKEKARPGNPGHSLCRLRLKNPFTPWVALPGVFIAFTGIDAPKI